MAQRAFDIVVNVDTSSAERQLTNFESELKQLQQELQALGASTSSSNGLDRFGQSAEAATTEVNQLDSATQNLGGGLGGLGGAIGQVDGDVGGLASSFTELAQTFVLVTQQAQNQSARMAELHRQYDAIDGAMNRADDAFQAGAMSAADYRSEMESLQAADSALDEQMGSLNRQTERQSSVMTTLRGVLRNTKVQIALVGAVAVLAAAQIGKMTTNLATLAQTDTTTLQTFANATNMFGINADQAANILKDFNDRIGDFVITGGGPFVDVMERLGKETGLTAEKIAGLSGPDGLIAVVDAMEKANVSTQEQVFLLESLGSDLTLLLPLLKNGGAELKSLAGEFDSVVTSGAGLSNLNSLSNEFAQTINILKTLFLELAGAIAPAMELLLGGFNKALVIVTKGVQGLSAMINLAYAGLVNIAAWTAHIVPGMEDVAEELGKLSAEYRKNAEELIALTFSEEQFNKEVDKTIENVKALRALQDKNAGKEGKTLETQIQNQMKLAVALSQSVEQYEKVQAEIANVAAQEKLRLDLQKKNLRPEQIEALVTQLKELQLLEGAITTAVETQTEAEAEQARVEEELLQNKKDLAEAEANRKESIADVIKGLENELEVLKATTEAERESIRNKHELLALNTTPAEAARIRSLQEQVLNQTLLNDANEKSIDITNQSIQAESNRVSGIEKYGESLQNQLELLKAKTEEERQSIEFQQKMIELNATDEESAQLKRINDQVIAQEELNRVLKAQEEAYGKLGASVTKWALGTEEAIIGVIAQIIQLIALSAGFDQNPVLKGFLSGFNGYADGGNFKAGETFMVGERGPEMITASAAGRVIPNHELGGSTGTNLQQNINLSINGSIVASDELDKKFDEFATAVADSTNSLLRNQMRTGGVLA